MASVLAAMLLVTAPQARAQGMGGMFREMERAPVTSRDIDMMIRMLELDETQAELARGLWEEMQAKYGRMTEQMRTLVQGAQEEIRATGDNSIWREVVEKFYDFADARDRLRESLFEEMRFVLTEEQAAEWPRFERRQYRSEHLGSGWQVVSGVNADVVVVIQDMDLDQETRQQIAPVIEQYERQIDTTLREYVKLQDEQSERWMEIWGSGDFMERQDEMEQMFGESRDVAVTLRDANLSAARQIQSRLPAGVASDFERRFKEVAFPNIYEPTFVDSAFSTALEVEGLTAEQQSQIETLRSQYSQQAESAKDRIAEARQAADASRTMRSMWGGGSTDDGVRDAESRLTSLNNEFYARVRDVLTDEQRGALPERDTGNDWRDVEFDF